MTEHPYLAQLAQLTGEFLAANNPSAEQLQEFQRSVATALLHQQDPQEIRSAFSFQKLDTYATGHLDSEDLIYLNNILTEISGSGEENAERKLRIFRRETPFASSQVKAGVAEWAHGAKVEKTLGPIIDKQGKPVWIDLYTTVPGVGIYLSGGSKPALVLTLQQGALTISRINDTSFNIPQSSIWINARLLSTEALDSHYCGITIQSGTISFSKKLALENKRISVPNGTIVTVSLNIKPQAAVIDSPDETGVDAKHLSVVLPATFSFSFSHAATIISAVADTSWKLYNQEAAFTFIPGSLPVYNPQMNRVGIPFKASIDKLNTNECLSKVCSFNESADIKASWWSLPCTLLDINNILDAAGAGGLLVQCSGGITAGWIGLRDLNLEEKETIQLTSPFVYAEPGRISVTDLKSSNTNARQQYTLWTNEKNNPSYLDLYYTQEFVFFYNCLKSGNESVMAVTNCSATIDRPVKVNGQPFSISSNKSVFMLNYSKALQMVTVYDDNLLHDAITGPDPVDAAPDVTFEPQAIALNNALFTVSPPSGFLLYGDLKNDTEFDKAIMNFTYGLVGYLPTLPDPYAADLDIFRRRTQRVVKDNRSLPVTSFNQLLVCSVTWISSGNANVNFAFGNLSLSYNMHTYDKEEETPVPSSTETNIVTNTEFALQRSKQLSDRRKTMLTERYNLVAGGQETGARMASLDTLTHNRAGRGFQPFDLFNLLDVSTAADLFGVSIGYVNEQIIFGEKFEVKPVESGSQLSVEGMDVVAESRFVRVYTVPQISWEPVINLTKPFNVINDPPYGILKFTNDGPPALIGNTGVKKISLAPLPATKHLTEKFAEDPQFKVWSLFTLPNGLISIGRFDQENHYLPAPNTKGATIGLIKANFTNGTSATIQISAKAGENPEENNHVFEGNTRQYTNVTDLSGTEMHSILGKTVTDIFNYEFADNGIIDRGIPLERYDFTGYGANVFSSWLNARARIAQVSQSVFDVWRGRTAKEIIQVRSILYPWGIRVVRTITMYRSSTGFEYRVDSGWRADSDGVYDFNLKYPKRKPDGTIEYGPDGKPVEITDGEPYVFHPGIIRGVFNVQNIIENDLAPFERTWFKDYGVYVDPNDGREISVGAGVSLDVELIPVYFDADVLIKNVEQGKVNGYVPSKKMLGYLQKSPRGVIISHQHLAELLLMQDGLGGPVDCIVNINESGQKMRIAGVDVNPSANEANKLVFVTAANGMPILPGDGSWSLAVHDKTSKDVVPIQTKEVSLIRKGVHKSPDDTNETFAQEIAVPAELFKVPEDRLKQYAFLQSTDGQKVLFRNPLFKKGQKILSSTEPDLADAYRLLNSTSIFPKLEDLPKVKIDQKGCAVKITEMGYQLVDKAAPDVLKSFEDDLPEGPWYFVNTNVVKIYVDYGTTGQDPVVTKKSKLQFDINSEASRWVNKMENITMVIDLGDIKRLFMIQGKFDTEKGKLPEFVKPVLVPGKELKPIIEILEVLASIGADPDYAELVKTGLRIAMSNSPDNWQYKFQADKEIPVLRFPPKYLDGPTTPLRLEAFLKLGCYFNMALPSGGSLAPSAGAFIEFGGKLSVMCVSLAAATVYAVGSVQLRISADTVGGPSLYMKYAFGVEIMVGLPVIGNVSVMYAMAVEVTVGTNTIIVGAFLIFRGRAEILGGIVTVTILIEAGGKVKKIGNRTDCIAQVTFSLDISICFVIDINFTETWSESRQIS